MWLGGAIPGSGSEDFEPGIFDRFFYPLVHPDHHFGGVSHLKKKLGIVLDIEPFHLLFDAV
jgi:hypothetical protein